MPQRKKWIKAKDAAEKYNVPYSSLVTASLMDHFKRSKRGKNKTQLYFEEESIREWLESKDKKDWKRSTFHALRTIVEMGVNCFIERRVDDAMGPVQEVWIQRGEDWDDRSMIMTMTRYGFSHNRERTETIGDFAEACFQIQTQ